MTKRERNDWRKWWQFMGRRAREFSFLAVWVAMAWALDAYIIQPFPITGTPRYMLFTVEGLFNISTLLELVLLLFWPYQAQTVRWFKQRTTQTNR